MMKSRLRAGAQHISMTVVNLPDGARAKAHLHREIETAVYVIEGETEMFFAITTLAARLVVEVGGSLDRGTYRYTRVWAREADDRWRVVGGHVSPVPQRH